MTKLDYIVLEKDYTWNLGLYAKARQNSSRLRSIPPLCSSFTVSADVNGAVY